jgi:Flp pilus assembly protein TadG
MRFRRQRVESTTTHAATSCSMRHGAAAVEFALVLPLFFLLIMGMIEVGRGLMVQQILTNASREGARAAIMDGATSTSVQTIVNNYLTGSTIPAGTITVTPNPLSNATARQPVTVTVSIPANEVLWTSSSFFSESATLSASATMLTEAED